MSLSPDAAELVSQIERLRAERRRRYRLDLDIIDAAYDRNIRRAERTLSPRSAENPFPLIKAYTIRLHQCRRAKRIKQHRRQRAH
jgi:hypothetical protein